MKKQLLAKVKNKDGLETESGRQRDKNGGSKTDGQKYAV